MTMIATVPVREAELHLAAAAPGGDGPNKNELAQSLEDCRRRVQVDDGLPPTRERRRSWDERCAIAHIRDQGVT